MSFIGNVCPEPVDALAHTELKFKRHFQSKDSLETVSGPKILEPVVRSNLDS